MSASGSIPLTIAAVEGSERIDPAAIAEVAKHLAEREPVIAPTWIWIGQQYPPVVPTVAWHLAAVTRHPPSFGFAANLLAANARTHSALIITDGVRFDHPFATPFAAATARLLEAQPEVGQVLLDGESLREAAGIGGLSRRDRLAIRAGDDHATAGGRFRRAPSLVSLRALRAAGPFPESNVTGDEEMWARQMVAVARVVWSPDLLPFERIPPAAATPLPLDTLDHLTASVVPEVSSAIFWRIERQVVRPSTTSQHERVLVVGPWVGEFGWQLCRWHAGVRRLVSERYRDHYIVVVGGAGHQALYEYAHEYWTIPHLPESLAVVRESERLLPKPRGEAIRRCLLAALAPALRELGRPIDHLAPRRFLADEQRFVRLSPSATACEQVRAITAERRIDRWFCVFPRERALNPHKNWPAAAWSALIRHLHERFGSGVVCMGGVDDTLAVPIAEPWFIDASRLDASGLDLDSAFLARAIGAIGSESGGPFLALLCGCPTLVLGGPTYASRYEQDENPLGTPCRYLSSADFQHPVEMVVAEIGRFFGPTMVSGDHRSDAEIAVPLPPIAARPVATAARTRLRIAYAGVFTVPHSDNICHADAFTALGHTVLRYDFRDRARALGGHHRMQEEFGDLLARERVDLAILSKFEGTSPDILQRYNELTRTFLWWPDWERNAGPEIYGHFAHATWGSCTGRQVAASIAAKVGRPIWHVFDGADPDIFRPSTPDPALACDVAFIGQRNPRRARILDLLEHHGYRCAFHGPGFRTPIYRDGFARLCSSAKVVLGINFGEWDGLFFSVRTWMALACGTCFVPEYVSGMEEIFEQHRHVVWWRDEPELLAVLDRYVRQDDGRARSAIGLTGRELTLQSYTWRDTAARMLAIVDGTVAPVAECATV